MNQQETTRYQQGEAGDEARLCAVLWPSPCYSEEKSLAHAHQERSRAKTSHRDHSDGDPRAKCPRVDGTAAAVGGQHVKAQPSPKAAVRT